MGELIGLLLQAVAETSPKTSDDILNVLKDLKDIAANVLDTLPNLFNLIDNRGD